MTTNDAVQDWLRVHRLLIDQESRFTDLAMRAASGEVTPQFLARERGDLMALRSLCTAAYEKAFPSLAGPPSPMSST